MTRRIVIHGGFHKTGTSSAQAFLAENGPALWPVMALGMRYRFPKLLAAARGFSTWRDPVSLAKFRHRFEDYLANLNLGKRDLLISAEELSGHLPGRGDLVDFSAAPILMRAIEEILLAAYSDAHITFVFTLRQPQTWWPSAYWEHVKSSRMTIDYAEFINRYGALDLNAEARAIDVRADLKTFYLEDIAELEHGPATPMLDLMDLSQERRAKLKPVPRKNATPPDRAALITEFLRLNRSDLDQDRLKAAKQALLDNANGA